MIELKTSEKQLISEFSRKLQTPIYSPRHERWVSKGFEKEIGWESQAVPSVIREAVSNNLFRLNDNYPPPYGEVTLLAREFGSYAVLAVATREIDESERPLVGYRYFWLEKPTPDTDGVGALLDWWQQEGQPTFHLDPEQMQEEYVKPKWATVRDGQFVPSLLKEPETLPHVLLARYEPIGYQDLHALSAKLKKQYGIPVAWAWNVQLVDKPDVFPLISCPDENSASLNLKYIKRPQLLPKKKSLFAS